jgi:hypothetical protein
LKAHRLKIHRIGQKIKSKSSNQKSIDCKDDYEVPSTPENLVINTEENDSTNEHVHSNNKTHDTIHKNLVFTTSNDDTLNKNNFANKKAKDIVEAADYIANKKSKNSINTAEEMIEDDFTVEGYVEHDINSSNILHLDIQEQVTIVHIPQ